MPHTAAPPPLTRTAQGHRFHLLDALRGVLAVLVVYRHCPAYLRPALHTKNIFLAVDFFFCLSGFVIAYAYEERLRGGLRLQDFLVARIIRFYPTFFLGTAIAFAIAVGPKHVLSQPNGSLTLLAALPSLLFLPSAGYATGLLLYPLNMSCWTLLLELVANMGYALLVRTRRLLYPLLGCVCLLSWCVLAFSARPLDSGSTWPGAAMGCARIGFSFSVGVFLLALWKKVRAPRLPQAASGCSRFLAITAVLLGVILLHAPFTASRWYQLTILTIVLPSLIFLGAELQLNRRIGGLCVALGDLSYPLYILHLPLLSPLFGLRVHQAASHSWLLLHVLVPGYIVVLASAAWAIREYVDAPLGRWLLVRYRKRQSAKEAHKAAGPSLQLVPGYTGQPTT